jgi:hypothetical protein
MRYNQWFTVTIFGVVLTWSAASWGYPDTMISTPDAVITHGKYAGKKIQGSGRASTEARAIGSFESIRLAGAIDIKFKIGPKPSVTVTIDDNLQSNVTATVVGNELVINDVHNFSTKLKPVVEVTAPSLAGIALAGAGDIDIDALQGKALSASMTGAGDVRIGKAQLEVLQVELGGAGDFSAMGTAGTVTLTLNGAGNINTKKLQAKNVQASVSGVGTATVTATVKIDADVSGVGDIVVYGKPSQVSKSVSGMGTVTLQ